MGGGDTIIVGSSRFKAILLALLSVALAAFFAWGAWEIIVSPASGTSLFSSADHNGRYDLIAPMLPLLLPACCFYLTWRSVLHIRMVLTPPQLEVGAQGFTQHLPWKTERWRWDEAKRFRIAPNTHRMFVQFEDDRPRTDRQWISRPRIVRFPATYSIKASALVELLTESQLRWGSGHLALNPPNA